MLQVKLLLKTLVTVIAAFVAVVAVPTPSSDATWKAPHKAAEIVPQADVFQVDVLSRGWLGPSFTIRAAAGQETGFFRTCRCSCGSPCKTNADCGPGGVCASGITCCAVSARNGSVLADARQACRVAAPRRRC